jgi:transcriptional regulator with XRE-family HTH domain
MAERMGVTRVTLGRLERGDLAVGLGVLVRALGVLGLEEDLAELASNDDLGRRLVDAASSTKRRRGGSK